MPEFYLFGGPNGAGKTTIARQLLPALECREFVNADLIAGGLSPFEPERVALQAGVLLMKRLRDLRDKNIDFATESTLSARAYVPFIEDCQRRGYRFNLIYFWLPSDDLAVERVASRVRNGGHTIPEATIRRRYKAGRRNFFELYMPLADFWRIYDNSQSSPIKVAEGHRQNVLEIFDYQRWRSITAD